MDIWEIIRENELTLWHSLFVATLFQKLPGLKLAIAFEEIKYTNPHMDIGIVELPIVF